MKKLPAILLSALLLASSLTACTANSGLNPAGTNKPDEKIDIVATIFPEYDFVRAITGGKADLTLLVKPGTEIHSYDPSPADIIKIQNADVFIYIGGENDAWVDSILKSMDTSHKEIIRLMDCVTPVEEEDVGQSSTEKDHGTGEIEYDEHIWTSPKNAILMVNAIADSLSQADAKNVDAYQQNAQAYTAKIKEIDEKIQGIVNQSKTKLLVFGDRFPFRYFADEFGLAYAAAFNGCSTETEASAGTMAALINAIKRNDIHYVYSIELSNQNIARSISEQTGAGILLLHSCQSVSKEEFDAGATYVSLMEQNAENLKKGLNVS